MIVRKFFNLISFAFLLIFELSSGLAQNSSQYVIPQDTSFTIEGTVSKVTKQYPFARLVDSIVPESIMEYRNVIYTSNGTRDLHLDIFTPRNKKKAAIAVLIIHGGGWRSGDRSMEWPTAIRLAEKGYVAATVEYRLSPEAKYPAAVYDIKTAVCWLREHSGDYNIDSNKIAISGCSSGGELAAFICVTNGMKKFDGEKTNSKYSSRVQAVIDVDGILDFTDPAESGKDTIASKPSAGKEWFGVSYKANPNLWKDASPIKYIDKNCPPICFINSSLPRFHAGRDSTISKLKSLNIYSEVHTIPNTPHTFWLFHPWFDEVFNHLINFLDKNL